MKGLEASGRTVEEAVEKALDRLGLNKNMALVEVLCEPNQGLFGFLGSKMAKVLVTPRYKTADYLQQYLQTMLRLMNMEAEVRVEEDENTYNISISGQYSGVMIGRRGKTLNEIQYLTGTILRRQFPGENRKVIVDVGNYRRRREQTLSRLAERAANKVVSIQQEISMEPMTPQERRIIHLALKENGAVYTYSKGEEPYRRVVVAPK